MNAWGTPHEGSQNKTVSSKSRPRVRSRMRINTNSTLQAVHNWPDPLGAGAYRLEIISAARRL